MLQPLRPTLVSDGLAGTCRNPAFSAAGFNHVPVLNLFERHNYKSGEQFLSGPAGPRGQTQASRRIAQTQHPNVDVKVWIDDTGQVTKAELLSDDVEPDVADIASNAAYKWTFEPARLSDRPVSSEMVMHFHFAPKQNSTESCFAPRHPCRVPARSG